MILFQNWRIRHVGNLFARQCDNLPRVLAVSGVPDGYDWAMMVKSGGNFDKIALEPMENGYWLMWNADMDVYEESKFPPPKQTLGWYLERAQVFRPSGILRWLQMSSATP